MKKKEELSENEPNQMEVSNLLYKELKVMVLKKIIDNYKKLNDNFKKLNENYTSMKKRLKQ